MSPKSVNLSPQAIRKAVFGQSLQHPSVVYPAALGALGGIGAAVLASSPLWLGAAAAAGGVALIALTVNVFARHDNIAGHYLKKLRERLARERQAQIADLAGDLAKVNAKEGTRQLGRFVEKIDTFQSILSEKLSPNELTYARFSAIAEAVFLAGIENLRSVHLSLKALATVDEAYLEKRIETLEKTSKEETAELKGLRQQAVQAAGLRKRVSDRLGENELALAELDKATAAVGEMKTGSEATLDMESAMAELARIAQRSAHYH